MIDYVISYRFRKGNIAGDYPVTARDKKHAFMKFQNACMRLICHTIIVVDIVEREPQ